MKKYLHLLGITVLMVLGLSGMAQAEDPVPVGSQFLVNTDTTGTQDGAHIAAGGGQFIVVWNDANLNRIFGQRFAVDGTRLGSQLALSGPASRSASPRVAANSSGEFVTSWNDGTGFGASLLARRFAADGSALTPVLWVPSGGNLNGLADVILDDSGNFVVVWRSFASNDPDGTSIQAQRFAADGSKIGGQFLVNTVTAGSQEWPRVAIQDDGKFLALWTDFNNSATQLFDASGAPIGNELRTNPRYSYAPDVAAGANGEFLTASYVYQQGIMVQRVNADGTYNGAQARIDEVGTNPFGVNGFAFPSVDGTPSGDFVVTWKSYEDGLGDTDGAGIHGRVVAADGTPRSGEFLVNSFTTGFQRYSAVAVDTSGDFMVVWDSQSDDNGDGSGFSIQGQLFSIPQSCDLNHAVRATTGNITVGPNALVDSYSSCDDPAVFGNDGDLQASGSITVDQDATVNGALIPNTSSDPTPVPLPDGISLQGNLEVRSNETKVFAAGDYYYDAIFIKDNSRIETTGEVRIWFRSRLEVGGNAPILPQDNLPSNLTFYSTDSSNYVEVKSNALLLGSIVAPNVNGIRINSNAEIFGSVVGASIDLISNAIVHRDTALCGCP